MQVSIKRRPAEHIDIRLTLLEDTRLSAEAIGMLCFVLATEQPTTDAILSRWNANRRKELHIGKDKLRRIVNEWRVAGYAAVQPNMDDDGKLIDKNVVVFDESMFLNNVTPVTSIATEIATISREAASSHKFPAAQIFQDTFGVDLDLDSLRHIEKEVAKDYKTWGRVVGDHYASLTQQQKDNVVYKTRAVKFCLADMRREVELAAYRQTKTPMKKQDEESPTKKRTFADYVASYKHGSTEYENFKTGWLKKAEETDNTDAITQVDEYERIQLSLARIKETKRGVKE